MLAALTSYLGHIPQLAGVELLLADGDRFTANLVTVRRRGGKVHFERGEYGLTAYGAIRQHLPTATPVVLTISGKGIIHRVLTGERGHSDAELLRQVLPNAKPDDFYVQLTELDRLCMVSVARRQQIDDIVKAAGDQGLELLAVTLGPFAVDAFKDYLIEPDKGSFAAGHHRFTVSDGKIAGYELLSGDAPDSGRPVDIGGEQLNARLVPAFAAAFLAISDIPFPQLPVSDVLSRAFGYRDQNAFRRSAVAVMAFFLLLLLVNAFFFMHYSEKVNGFAGSDALIIQREIKTLQEQAAERETLLHGLWHSSAPEWGMAYMADRLAGSLPDGILLSELAVYPRDEAASRKERRPVHSPSVIRIKGTCADAPQLNGWIQAIRQLAFCRAVEIDAYAFDQRNGNGVFTLSLTLSP